MVSYMNDAGNYEFRGLSTDTKPTQIVRGNKTLPMPNMSVFLEVNTGNVFFFNQTNSTWVQIP